MKKNIKGFIVVLLTLSFSGNLFADESSLMTGDLSLYTDEQSENQKIEIKKSIFGNQYVYDDVELNISEIEDVISVDPEAYNIVKKGKLPYYLGCGFGGAGGGIIGYELGYSLASGKEIHTTTILVGASSILVGYILSIISDGYYENGIITYNDNLK